MYLYINDLVKALKSEGCSCCLSDTSADCLLFADDILLLSASIIDVQCMLNVCYSCCDYWDLKCNVRKSNVM